MWPTLVLVAQYRYCQTPTSETQIRLVGKTTKTTPHWLEQSNHSSRFFTMFVRQQLSTLCAVPTTVGELVDTQLLGHGFLSVSKGDYSVRTRPGSWRSPDAKPKPTNFCADFRSKIFRLNRSDDSATGSKGSFGWS